MNIDTYYTQHSTLGFTRYYYGRVTLLLRQQQLALQHHSHSDLKKQGGRKQFPTDTFDTTALCKEIVQKFQKKVSKSCLDLTFLTIPTCELLLVDPKFTLQM